MAELQVFVAFSSEYPSALCVPAGWMVVPEPAKGGDDRLIRGCDSCVSPGDRLRVRGLLCRLHNLSLLAVGFVVKVYKKKVPVKPCLPIGLAARNPLLAEMYKGNG